MLTFKNSKPSCIQILTKNTYIAIAVSIKLALLCPINMHQQKKILRSNNNLFMTKSHKQSCLDLD